MGIKFYKENNQYVLGDSALDYKPAGEFTADVHGDYLAIVELGTGIKRFDNLYSSYEDSNGTPYASMNALMTAISGFFASSASSTQLVDASGNTLAPSGKPIELEVEITRPSDIIGYTIGDSINSTVAGAFNLANASIATGGGGFITKVKVETNITAMAGASLRLYFFKDTPSTIIADNSPMTLAYADSSKRLFYIDVILDTLVSGSDTIFGQTNDLATEYICVGTSLYLSVQTNTAFTPTSGGKIKIDVSVIKLT